MTRLIIIENPSDGLIKELVKSGQSSLFSGDIVCHLTPAPLKPEVKKELALLPKEEIPEDVKAYMKKARKYVNSPNRNRNGKGGYKPRDSKKPFWKLNEVGRHYDLTIKEMMRILEFLKISTIVERTDRMMQSEDGPKLNSFLTNTPIL